MREDLTEIIVQGEKWWQRNINYVGKILNTSISSIFEVKHFCGQHITHARLLTTSDTPLCCDHCLTSSCTPSTSSVATRTASNYWDHLFCLISTALAHWLPPHCFKHFFTFFRSARNTSHRRKFLLWSPPVLLWLCLHAFFSQCDSCHPLTECHENSRWGSNISVFTSVLLTRFLFFLHPSTCNWCHASSVCCSLVLCSIPTYTSILHASLTGFVSGAKRRPLE